LQLVFTVDCKHINDTVFGGFVATGRFDHMLADIIEFVGIKRAFKAGLSQSLHDIGTGAAANGDRGEVAFIDELAMVADPFAAAGKTYQPNPADQNRPKGVKQVS